MELIFDSHDLLHDTQIDIDKSQINTLILSSSDDNIGCGNLLQFNLIDVSIIEHDEEGWKVTVNENVDGVDETNTYEAFDIVIL